MRLSCLFLSLVVGSSLVACGGDDDPMVVLDAAADVDAAMPDASVGLTGLGKACASNADCPTNASECVLGIYCSPLCLTEGVGTATATGFNITEGTDNGAACMTSYNGDVGTPACNIVLRYEPMDDPPVAGNTYTNMQAACSIGCGPGNACPTGTTCNTQFQICLPS